MADNLAVARPISYLKLYLLVETNVAVNNHIRVDGKLGCAATPIHPAGPHAAATLKDYIASDLGLTP